ncbi:SAM-dependent methyltransferase [Streptomyces sp. SID3343]|uniref:SAM-dependent methyltransferase n=1 Tax=Streptomyces sp. SID3343 TaxID=2690260 RepID=UPI00137115B0|nr:SAM-dependent methyltransferase [Streptomyces sp. SID3343]MYW03331.1 SAM-dependent methyltransferase [Streptomyces sp. SID3343]MYW06263.1 SAM-dependent methyltransferase [Streptomyces sp. SID3343]
MTHDTPAPSTDPASSRVAHRAIDADTATDARIHNRLLDGRDHYDCDKDACLALLRIAPRAWTVVRAARAFTERAVRKLAEEFGVRQFVDLGCGLPAARNVHQIAQSAHPHARVVYVDRDPSAIGAGNMVLDQNDDIAVVDADITDHSLLDHPDITRLIDPARPTAVLLANVLQCVPDSADPAELIGRITRWQAPGSYLAVSHLVSDDKTMRNVITETMLAATRGNWGRIRERHDIHRLLAGLPLVQPGLIEVSSWYPDVHPGPRRRASGLFTYGGIARVGIPGP